MTHHELGSFLLSSEGKPHHLWEATRLLVIFVELDHGEDLKLAFKRLGVVTQIKLFQNCLSSVVLDGETGEDDGLLRQTMLLVDDEREEKVHVGRILHVFHVDGHGASDLQRLIFLVLNAAVFQC